MVHLIVLVRECMLLSYPRCGVLKSVWSTCSGGVMVRSANVITICLQGGKHASPDHLPQTSLCQLQARQSTQEGGNLLLSLVACVLECIYSLIEFLVCVVGSRHGCLC